MRIVLCVMAVLAVVTTAAGDDAAGPIVGEPYILPSPPAVYGPPPPRRGNSFRIMSGSSISDGSSGAGYSIGGGPVFEWYHAESSFPSADMPVYTPYCNTGAYGPMMLDVLLFTDISSRF